MYTQTQQIKNAKSIQKDAPQDTSIPEKVERGKDLCLIFQQPLKLRISWENFQNLSIVFHQIYTFTTAVFSI
jgi:hypothetical protein